MIKSIGSYCTWVSSYCAWELSRAILLVWILCVFVGGGLFWVESLHAATPENTELVDEFDDLESQEQREDVTQLQERMDFKSFESCDEMDSVLQEFLLKNKEYFQNRGFPRYYWEGMVWSDMLWRWWVEESAPNMADWDVATDSAMGIWWGSPRSTNEVSETNIQVSWVDEPDILKTDGEFLYYYNKSNQTIAIVRSPLDRQTSTISIDEFETVSTIAIPDQFNNIELFIEDDTLVILWQRWREHKWTSTVIDQYSRVNLVTYDVSNPESPRLTRFSDMDWSYQDARMIDGKVYIITQLGVNWGDIWQEFSQAWIVDTRGMLPKSIDVARTQNPWNSGQQLSIDGTTYPYDVTVNTTDCNSIMYVLPTTDSLQDNGLMPSFTIVRSVDVTDTDSAIDSLTAFGSTQEVHMTKESLYLTSPIYFDSWTSCPPGMGCIMPRFRGWDSHTLLHKFERNDTSLSYNDSTLLPWSPLTQWSMSEDDLWNFRIITETRVPNLNTHLFVLWSDLEVRWMVRNIQENEEFKASRFMGDKLYLVTFERVDPLFVIDIEDPERPSIIWELKIPWYSTYLHPFTRSSSDDSEYLIWLWYDTRINEWWGVVNAWVKVDLYKVDYTDLDDQWMVAVTQEFTETYWEDGSWSEAIENPRMFVWNEQSQTLILPVILQDRQEQQHCNVQYNADGEEIRRNCWESFDLSTTFAGMKRITIDPVWWIQEIASIDYKEQLETEQQRREWPIQPMPVEPMPVEADGWVSTSADGTTQQSELSVSDGDEAVDIVREIPDQPEQEEQFISQREFRNLMMRVWYLGDAVYALHNQFGHIRIPWTDQEAYIRWEE